MTNSPDSGRSPTWLRVALFLGLYGVLHLGYQALRSSRLDPWFIHALTVRPAADIVSWLWPADGVAAAGSRLIWPGGQLTLLAGCDGFEVMSLFAAAMLVAEVPWRRGLAALVVGCVAIWALNQLRIAALYWSFRNERSWFDAIHTVWGPALLVVTVAAFYACVTRVGARPWQAAA